MSDNVPMKTIKRVMVLTDLGSANTDDDFSLLLLLHAHINKEIILTAIIVTHFWSADRAKAIYVMLHSLGLSNEIPIWLDYNTPLHQPGINESPSPEDVKLFTEQNPLWPREMFGSPIPTEEEKSIKGRKQWNPSFLLHYRPLFKDYVFPIFPDAKEQFIRYFSAEVKDSLTMVVQSPVLFLADVLDEIKMKHHEIYVKVCATLEMTIMGAGFNGPDSRTKSDNSDKPESMGYNVGINPFAWHRLLQLSYDLRFKPIVISSQLIRDWYLNFGNSEYESLQALVKNSTCDEFKKNDAIIFATALMEQWKSTLSVQVDVETKKTIVVKPLADPATAAISLGLLGLETMDVNVVVHLCVVSKMATYRDNLPPGITPWTTTVVDNNSFKNIKSNLRLVKSLSHPTLPNISASDHLREFLCGRICNLFSNK